MIERELTGGPVVVTWLNAEAGSRCAGPAADPVDDYRVLGPDAVRTPSGAVLTVVGRAALRLETSNGAIDIDSEMLEPAMTIAVYPASISSPFVAPRLVLAETLGGLERLGFTVELVGSLPS